MQFILETYKVPHWNCHKSRMEEELSSSVLSVLHKNCIGWIENMDVAKQWLSTPAQAIEGSEIKLPKRLAWLESTIKSRETKKSANRSEDSSKARNGLLSAKPDALGGMEGLQ